MKLKLSNTLRFKVTCMAIFVFSCMCFFLTLTTQSSSNNLVESIQTLPAKTMWPVEDPESSPQTDDSHLSTPALPIASLKQATKTFRFSIWGSMFLAVFLGSLIIYLYTKHLLKPLETFTNKVQDIQISNLNDSFVLEDSTREIQQLSLSFDGMAKRIHESYLMQKCFSSNAAHELRTPLAILQTQLDVFLLNHPQEKDEIVDFIKVLQNHSNRLTNMVEELLELTNEQALPMNQEVYLMDLFEELFIELEDLANSHNITLSLENQTALTNPVLLGNDGLLERAFFNLLENAVKYNVTNGTVMVTLSEKKGKLYVKISDTGIGIPKEEQVKIFEAFYRVDKSRSRQIGGSGLGLAIVAKILEKHKAQLKLEPQKPQGTCFTIIF